MNPKMSRPADPAAVLKRVIRYMLHYYKLPFALVVLTLGSAGSCCMKDGEIYRQGIVPVKAVDTTAAGDTFTGFFLKAYLEGQEPGAALALAAKASSITVSRPGAANSIPTIAEVEGA